MVVAKPPAKTAAKPRPSRSKTGNPACSQAVSAWKTLGMSHAIALVLAQCRAQAKALRTATLLRAGGKDLKAQALTHRANRAKAGGPITKADRTARAKELLATRAAKNAARAKVAKPKPAKVAKPKAEPKPKAAKTPLEKARAKLEASKAETAAAQAKLDTAKARVAAKQAELADVPAKAAAKLTDLKAQVAAKKAEIAKVKADTAKVVEDHRADLQARVKALLAKAPAAPSKPPGVTHTPSKTLAEATARAKSLGVHVVAGPRPVTLAELDEVNRRVSLMPAHVRETIAAAGMRLDVIAGQGIPDHPDLGHLRGVTPRGWPAGTTWDDVPGSGGYAGSAVTVIVANRLDQGHSSHDLVLHEHTHTYDEALRRLTGTRGSDTPEWRAAHKSADWQDAYLSVPEEGYAESLAKYLHSPTSRASLPPVVHDYWYDVLT